VLSVFMVGLALGSLLAGRIVDWLAAQRPRAPIVAYALAEWGIGAGAFVVPAAFAHGHAILARLGDVSSTGALAVSAVFITLALLGFTTLMGMTWPLMMGFIRATSAAGTAQFSFLYAANVLGATAGASMSALVLIELLGFRRTLAVAGAVNVLIGLAALIVGLRTAPETSRSIGGAQPPTRPAPADTLPTSRFLFLFVTGFSSLGMEVVWTRAFTPVLETTIYAFALLLTVYLLATWFGAALYRSHLARGGVWSTTALLAALSGAAMLPLLLNDPRWLATMAARYRVPFPLLSIAPVSALLGYLTSRLVDDHSQGDPRIAGAAYTVNALGCIAGPLVAGYALLPWLGVKWSIAVLAAGFVGLFAMRRPALRSGRVVAIAALWLIGLSCATTYEDPRLYVRGTVRRDYAATVISDDDARGRRLLVNGYNVTGLTSDTKIMAHLPLVFRPQPPRSTLVICLGMGTTFRSASSWGGKTTAVELAPGVRDAFFDFFADASTILARPGQRIVIDDGRRFLLRSPDRS
jgi:spermidine synthase